MHITLFGGSFNPPHLGHLIVIQQAFELIPRIDQLWVLPAYSHTFQKELLPCHHRISMAQALIAQLPSHTQAQVKLETVECDQQLPGETHLTIRLLQRAHPGHTFSFLMGTDQLPHFHRWGHYQDLLKLLHFYIYPRPGFDGLIQYDNMSLLSSPDQVITNISSTLLRRRLTQGLPITHLAPQAINQYITDKGLYA